MIKTKLDSLLYRYILAVPMALSFILELVSYVAIVYAFIMGYGDGQVTLTSVVALLVIMQISKWASSYAARHALHWMKEERLRNEFGYKFHSWDDLYDWLKNAPESEVEEVILSHNKSKG